ncbi:MAG: hypothetical protein Kow0062_22780 [Acidobacteriota bacterium]
MAEDDLITLPELETGEDLAPGTAIAGSWRVERSLGEHGGVAFHLLRAEDGAGLAIAARAPVEAGEPAVDEEQAAFWGTVRRVLRDERLGRIVLDELPDGALLADRIAAGREAAAGPCARLEERVREAHRLGWAHGALAPELVVVGDEGLAVAGWGIAAGDPEDLKARDSSALAGLGAGAREPREALSTASLRAAIVSDHLPTLRAALEQWQRDGGSPVEPDALRAADALARLERRVAEQLGKARSMLERGDTLGAVACCREAIRLGAEQEAGPLLEAARRASRRQLSVRRLPSRQVLSGVALAAVILGLLAVALVLALREDPALAALRERVAAAEREQGLRAAVRLLIDARDGGRALEEVDVLLSRRLAALAEAERTRMVGLRADVVARGGRPRRADEIAEQALDQLEQLAGEGAGAAALSVRLDNILGEIDRAAVLYRASVALSVEEVEQGVEELIAIDPVLATETPR